MRSVYYYDSAVYDYETSEILGDVGYSIFENIYYATTYASPPMEETFKSHDDALAWLLEALDAYVEYEEGE